MVGPNGRSLNFRELRVLGSYRNRRPTPAPRRRKSCALVVPLGNWVRIQLASQMRSAMRGDRDRFNPPPACTARLLLLSMAPLTVGKTLSKPWASPTRAWPKIEYLLRAGDHV